MIEMFTPTSRTPVLAPTPTSDEIEAQVALIVSSLGSTYRDYIHACETYNLVFFRDEPTEFTSVLARALTNHYPVWPNLYWKKLVANQNGLAA